MAFPDQQRLQLDGPCNANSSPSLTGRTTPALLDSASVKYVMSSKNDLARLLIERFKQSPIMLTIKHRFDFDAVMVIETHGNVDYVAARDFTRSDEMCGRVRPQPNMRDDIVQWFFELEEDAILFTLKFGSGLPRRLK